ncbi:MAG: hypothetical protein R2729_08055 [Bryobacteraceae bacterium]
MLFATHTTHRIRVGFDLYWLRETPAGKLEGCFGRRLPCDSERVADVHRDPDGRIDIRVSGGTANPPAALAAENSAAAEKIGAVLNDAVAARLTSLLAAGAPTPEEIHIGVHIPFEGRRSPNRNRIPAPRHDASGAIYFGDPAVVQGVTLAPGPVARLQSGDPIPWALRYSTTNVIRAGDVPNSQIQSVLDRHRVTIPLPEWRGDIAVTWLLTLDPSAGEAWTNLPPPSTNAFSRQMRNTMFAIQYALRTFVPYHFFLDFKSLSSRGRAWPMLVYSAMRPVLARAAHRYGYDVLDRGPLYSALRWASRPLRARLQWVHQRLTANGRRDLGSLYPIAGRGRIIRLMAEVPRRYGMLLAGENRVLNIVRLTAEFAYAMTASLRRGEDIIYSQLQARRLYKQLKMRLDRLYTDDRFAHLAPLIAIAATWGLAHAQGRRPRLELQLRVEELETGSKYAWSREISYANPRGRSALTRA